MTESAAAEAASAQVISSMRDSAQVTSSGAINSMIAAMSTRPNRQNRSTCSRISVSIALTPPPPCEPVHMRCAPMRRTRAHCARSLTKRASCSRRGRPTRTRRDERIAARLSRAHRLVVRASAIIFRARAGAVDLGRIEKLALRFAANAAHDTGADLSAR